MKKQLLSIGLSLAVLGGSAVTALPANASTSPTTKTVTQYTAKQKAQAEIVKLEKENKVLKERQKFLDLEIADNGKTAFTDNDLRAIMAHSKMKSAERFITSNKCELDATNKMISSINTAVKKKELSKKSADRHIYVLKFKTSDSKTKIDRSMKIYKSESVIAKKYEKLGVSWKIQRPIYDKFDYMNHKSKKDCLSTQYRVFTSIGNSSNMSAKDYKTMKAISDSYAKNVSGSVVQKKLSNEQKKLIESQRSHNKLVYKKMNDLSKKIASNNAEIAKLKLVK